ncbi:ankyrin repeat-containing domain protein [Dissophora ornata]|nr:ankyrin repeat-containing domain protein [Dissophora ornata]
MEFYIAARRHESGRQWLSHEEIKARKAAKAEAAKSSDGKKRFSPEMHEFWKGKSVLPVELAIASGNLDCARTILQRLGPNSLASSSFGLLLQNDVMLTLSLIKSGTPVSQHDLHGCTPLHLAARRGHLEMVMVLLQLGGDVNSRGERQWTALHESISQNHGNISSLLVACGADLLAKNEAGETPEDVGRRRGLAPEVLADHLDVAKAKNCSAGLVHSIGSHLQNQVSAATTVSRSGASSRRGSLEQLTSNTLKAMIMGNSERNASMDHSRLSQHYPSSLSEMNSGSGNRSPLTISQDSLHQLGAGGSVSNSPVTLTSSTSSLNGNRSSSSSSDKKKKVRGFLKKIFT